jgi:hypothetical protein
MKSDLGTWIYILIGVVVAVWSAVQKQKTKHVQQQPEKPEPEKRAPTFDPWKECFPSDDDNAKEAPVIGQETEKKGQPAPAPVYAGTPKGQMPASRFEKMSGVIDHVPTDEGESVFHLEEYDYDLIKKGSEQPEPSTINYLSDFELRKAVIYSEIINRKYV